MHMLSLIAATVIVVGSTPAVVLLLVFGLLCFVVGFLFGESPKKGDPEDADQRGPGLH